MAGTRALLDQVVADIGDVGLPVGWDPLAAVPPCVLVGVPDVAQQQTPCVWAVSLPVWVICPRSWDRFDIGRLVDTADEVTKRLGSVTWGWQPYAASPDLLLPAVRITLTGTLNLERT